MVAFLMVMSAALLFGGVFSEHAVMPLVVSYSFCVCVGGCFVSLLFVLPWGVCSVGFSFLRDI